MSNPSGSRRRPAFVPSTADGSLYALDSEDDAGSEGGTCALAQIGSGCLFAFLFGSLGFILTGDATRSLLWLVGLVLGATLGAFATRGEGAPGGEGGGDALATSAPARAALGAAAAGAAAGALLYWLLIPVLSLDNLMASIAAGSAAYASQGLATPHGRASAQLSSLAALRMVAEVVKGAAANLAGAKAAEGSSPAGAGGGVVAV